MDPIEIPGKKIRKIKPIKNQKPNQKQIFLAEHKESLKQKTEKDSNFMQKLNNQLITKTSIGKSPGPSNGSVRRSKPKPPPRAPSTRRQSDLSNFSASTISASASTNGMINPAYESDFDIQI